MSTMKPPADPTGFARSPKTLLCCSQMEELTQVGTPGFRQVPQAFLASAFLSDLRVEEHAPLTSDC